MQGLKEEGQDPADVLFVPHYYYSKGGHQFSEGIYHYLAGAVFRDMGFLVYDEYMPTYVTGKAARPDLSAFRSREIVGLLDGLRSRGLITAGAFAQELQVYGLFGRQKSEVGPPPEAPTDAEIVAVEAKRGKEQHIISKGGHQLDEYLSQAFGLYEEGYLTAPFVTGTGVVSFDESGGLVFVKDDQSHRTGALSDYWKDKRELQMRDVWMNAWVELAKNFNLQETLSMSGKDVPTYLGFLRAWEKADVEAVLEGLDAPPLGGQF
jgi:hypothetical protein